MPPARKPLARQLVPQFNGELELKRSKRSGKEQLMVRYKEPSGYYDPVWLPDDVTKRLDELILKLPQLEGLIDDDFKNDLHGIHFDLEPLLPQPSLPPAR